MRDERLGNYRVMSRIGGGGMGTVYPVTMLQPRRVAGELARTSARDVPVYVGYRAGPRFALYASPKYILARR